ncbi:GNAT family N-acetyltransferase [Rhizobium laguerreae]|uniref:GNAT family N-acetyltransferase n=1 Tax=Rhizobium laguerreae TaxID=1076926 RepID=UPI001C902E38|nr:GNAT family N-acetyltransferase [Rhizobium laguerreae]MBY3157340.1 GNAT family N-acetyltransferase [Rhizobium laguerreae]
MAALTPEIAFGLDGYSMSVERHERRNKRFAYKMTVREIGGFNVACGEFVANDLGVGSFEDIYVSPENRRRGIARAIYDAFEAAGFEVHPSENQDGDGMLFWEARLANARGLVALAP